MLGWDGGQATASDMYGMMLLSDNLLIYASYLPVGMVLLVKELSMMLYQFADIGDTSEYPIGIYNVLDLFKSIGNLFNPFWWTGVFTGEA